MMWAVYALLSAVFAALTGILAKLGMANINSKFSHRYSHHCGAGYGLGHCSGFRKTDGDRDHHHPGVDLSRLVRSGHRLVLAVLFPCPSNR